MLTPDFSAGVALPDSDSDSPLGFLDPVRRSNFKTIIQRVEQLAPEGPWLDVGCGGGLFLRFASGRGHTISGIEPKPEMARAAECDGIVVHQGLFPEVLGADQRFAAIFFNDVLEHLLNVDDVFDACKRHLLPRGVLTINVPNANGLYFQLATQLRKVGVAGPHERMWQTMFYSPHLHYFTPGSLKRLAAGHGYKIIGRIEALKSVTISGLWERVSADPGANLISRLLTVAGAFALVPLSRLFASDAMVAYFRVPDKPRVQRLPRDRLKIEVEGG